MKQEEEEGAQRHKRGQTFVKLFDRLALNLEKGWDQQSIPWLGRSDAEGLFPLPHVQGAWQPLFPTLSLELPVGIC